MHIHIKFEDYLRYISNIYQKFLDDMNILSYISNIFVYISNIYISNIYQKCLLSTFNDPVKIFSELHFSHYAKLKY